MPGLSEWPCAAAAGHQRGDSVARSGWGGGWRERRRRGVTGGWGGRRRLERIGGFCPPGCVIPASETSEALRLPLPPEPQRRALLLRREERGLQLRGTCRLCLSGGRM